MSDTAAHGAAAARRAAAAVRRDDFQPAWGVVLGSGFDKFVEALTDCASIPYSEIPGMPSTSVAGHRGVLHQGWLDQTPLAVLEGRLHTYEGHDAATATFPIRLLAALGIKSLFVTNAAGGLDPALHAGSLMLIRDHINLTAVSPLVGATFIDLTDLYSPRLRALCRAVDSSLDEGVYVQFPGPHYETPAEISMVRAIGGDLVGMSTALEAIAAREAGMEVLGISLVTNPAAGVTGESLDHREVLAAGNAAATSMGRLLAAVLPKVVAA